MSQTRHLLSLTIILLCLCTCNECSSCRTNALDFIQALKSL